MTREELSEILALLAECCPGRPVTKATAEAYLLVLGDLDAGPLKTAALEHIKGAKWFPSPSELRSRVIENEFGFPSVEDALAEVRQNISRAGQYSGLCEWSNPIIKEAAMTVGWFHLSSGDNPSAVHAQFRDAYEHLRASTLTKINTNYLALRDEARRLYLTDPASRLALPGGV